MKHIFKSAIGWSALFATLFILGCGKKSSPITPPEPPMPSISLGAASAKAPYNGAATGTFTVSNVVTTPTVSVTNSAGLPVSVSQSGTQYSWTVSSIVSQSKLAISVSAAGKTATDTVEISSFSSDETKLICWNDEQWKPVQEFVFIGGQWHLSDPTTWCYPREKFNPDGTNLSFRSDCGSPQNSTLTWVMSGGTLSLGTLTYQYSFQGESLLLERNGFRFKYEKAKW